MDKLAEKLPATFLNRDKVKGFADEMFKRVGSGKKEYPETYQFDPLEEAMQECIDIANYSMILYYRIKRLKEKLSELDSKRS